MVYLDNSATTRPAAEVTEALYEYMKEEYGNPSSLHKAGREAAKAVREARGKIALSMKAHEDEIYFTSGGTEADNIAILGAANIKKGSRIVTSAIEHPAVLNAVDALSEKGFEVIKIMPEKDGSIDPNKVIDAVNDKTSLVSIMHVNNETGAVINIAEISKAVKRKAPRALIHTDAVQSYGHIEAFPHEMGVDLMSVSAHKIHGPKGIGALFVKKGVNDLKSPVYGGGQEKGIRSGTENTYAIVGFGKAAELIDLKEAKRVLNLKNKLKDALLETGKAEINGGEKSSPYILNMSFMSLRSEVMLNALDREGIMVSSASACARGRAKSHVLLAMGARYADNAIRFSFSRYTTEEEIDYTIEKTKDILRIFGR